ncbi:hypothetical protein EYF80_024631 [Liparis tanakae]|uniref:Uncharacterized protein n=1 Tax=Liparis tanakae TaxID=230148 RepID=A0A4Z2HJT8_9TELE|nr:hypothetical protein EYF80_024631 [Liparis tanakae]
MTQHNVHDAKELLNALVLAEVLSPLHQEGVVALIIPADDQTFGPFVAEVSQSHVGLNDAAALHTVRSIRLKLFIGLSGRITQQLQCFHLQPHFHFLKGKDRGASAHSCGQDVEGCPLKYLLVSEYFSRGTLTVGLKVLCRKIRADMKRLDSKREQPHSHFLQQLGGHGEVVLKTTAVFQGDGQKGCIKTCMKSCMA